MEKDQNLNDLPLEQLIDLFYNLYKGKTPSFNMSTYINEGEVLDYSIHLSYKENKDTSIYIEISGPALKPLMVQALSQALALKYKHDVS